MTQIKTLIILVLALMLAGCTATYTPHTSGSSMRVVESFSSGSISKGNYKYCQKVCNEDRSYCQTRCY